MNMYIYIISQYCIYYGIKKYDDIECELCKEICEGEDFFGLKCKHIICNECYKSRIESKVDEYDDVSEIKCYKRGCKEHFDKRFFKMLFRDEPSRAEAILSEICE